MAILVFCRCMHVAILYYAQLLVRVSSRIFCLGGGGGEYCVQRSIVCEACKVFEPIFEYQSPMHEKT